MIKEFNSGGLGRDIWAAVSLFRVTNMAAVTCHVKIEKKGLCHSDHIVTKVALSVQHTRRCVAMFTYN